MVKIGLEIHGYLNTNEKLFCRCKSSHGMKFSKPNTNICPVCTGQPGAKPMLPNKTAINQVIQISLILGCRINSRFSWQRKHYDWPDLPKGFQSTISGTYAIPISENGKFLGIRIRETHLEEDPAAWNPQTGEVDYNRSGSPLIEIVTEPDFKNSEDVVSWIRQLITTLDYVKAIDKNSGIKIDVNVSLPEFKTERAEIKNINSLSNVKAAIEYEIQRQKKEKPIRKETRTFDDLSGKTIKMREKEQAEDYRFISEPDLPVIKIDKSRIAQIKSLLPETPHEKLQKLVKKHRIEKKYAKILVKKLEIVEFFEKIVARVSPILATHWVAGELLRVLNYAKKELEEVDIKAEHFIELLNMIEKNMITALKAKEILNRFVPKSFSPKKEISKHSVIGSEKEIGKIISLVLKENSKAVGDYKSGKPEAMNFLLGQIMKQSGKRINSEVAREILKKRLN
ncbi:Asp-tRNA(Asn)/Glu-tRNA(Gln) amidotransferase subunit GatB [Candidatus Pacearchaeota archaeon]|nr:Asp-tRNA(Asn)/Glu-tRNA(Gln) amidotransferase subunit GatB [Candidatus Pacearchaeota archaeon]